MSIKSSKPTSPPVHYILLVLPFFLVGWIGGWSQAIKRGNAHYKAEAYDAALEAYQSAAEDRPEDAIARYNLGTVLYQKKQFEKASDEFRQSLDTADPVHQAQGYYNLGNAQVQLNDIEGAIRSYKSALRLNPADLDAKHNLELALEKLEQKSQQNQSESGDEGRDRQEQDQQQQNHDQQDRDEQGPDQQDQNQQNQTSPAESEQQQNQESPEQEAASEESPSQSERGSTQQPVEMSEEDAIRLLEAVKDNEKEIQKKILQKRFSRRQRSEKDW